MTTNEGSGGEFEGKVAIVTGAASGIGLATAQLLAARGAQVVAEDVNPNVKTVFANDPRIVPFVGDVATEEAARDVVALAQERFGQLDILVKRGEDRLQKRRGHDVGGMEFHHEHQRDRRFSALA